MTLTPSLGKRIMLLLVCLVFACIGGVWVFREPNPAWQAYLCFVFFGVGTLIFSVMLLPGASYLKLTDQGFEFRNLFRSTYVIWNEVVEFGVLTIYVNGLPANKMVGFNFQPAVERGKWGRKFSHAVAEFEGALPDTYGMKAEELAALMNEWRSLHATTSHVRES